jgi:hypothetical protein
VRQEPDMHDCRVDGRDLAFVGTDNVRLGLVNVSKCIGWRFVHGCFKR